jgi:hypothetical protein
MTPEFQILMRIAGPALVGLAVAMSWKLRRAYDEADGIKLVILPAILGALGLSLLLESAKVVIVNEPAWVLAALSGALAVEGFRRT